jgi:hypothetical protein
VGTTKSSGITPNFERLLEDIPWVPGLPEGLTKPKAPLESLR